jgi:hypothetical protein
MLMRRSEYLLGRRPIRERLARYGTCRVACVQCLPNIDPWRMYVETTRKGRARKPVLYRIKITLKGTSA